MSTATANMAIGASTLFALGAVGCVMGRTIIKSKDTPDDPSSQRDIAALEGTAGMCVVLLLLCMAFFNYKLVAQ